MRAVVKQYDLDHLSILPRIIAEITEFISSEAGTKALAVYKRVSIPNSNNEFLSFDKRKSQELSASDRGRSISARTVDFGQSKG